MTLMATYSMAQKNFMKKVDVKTMLIDLKSKFLFLKKNKFKIKVMETIMSDAGAVENYINYNNIKNPYMGNNKEKYNVTEPNCIHKNLHGYSILCVATK